MQSDAYLMLCFSSSKAEDTASDSVEAAKNASDKKGKRCIMLGVKLLPSVLKLLYLHICYWKQSNGF